MKSAINHICLLLMMLAFSVNASANEESREFSIINAADGLADNSAQYIVCTKTGRMIISTIGNVNFYDGTSFTHIDTDQSYQYLLSDYRGNDRLYFDHFHHLWVKSTHSVTCVDLRMEVFRPNVDGVLKELGCDQHVLDLFTDYGGDLWLLTDKGLYDIDRKKEFQVLKDRNLQDLDTRGDTLLTFFDNGEEMGIDVNSGQIIHRTNAYDWETAQKYIQSSICLKYKNGYFVIRNGEAGGILMFFDFKTLQWKHLLTVPYALNNMAVSNEKLFVAAGRGYWVHDIKTGEQQHIEKLKLASGKELDVHCNTVMFDKQGGLWFGTQRYGVLYAAPSPSPFHVYTFDHPKAVEYAAKMDNLAQNITEFNGKSANCMFTDSRSWNWFGTMTGLYLYKNPKSEPIVFNKKNGLVNEVIHSVVEDKNHNIWIGTSYGIACIIFEGNEIVLINNFTYYDKVPNESFVNCKAVCLDDGTIIMQSIDHVVEFNPAGFELVNNRRPVTMYPKLIKLMVNGTFVEPGETLDGRTIISSAITRVREINVNSDQNTLSLTFSGLNYFRPQQTCYRVRLREINDEWNVYSYFQGSELVDAKGNLHLPLIGLKPGDYHIEVQASMFPDSWEGTIPYEWVIHVNQPWWQATGLYMLIIVVIMILFVINFLLYGKNTKMRARRNTEEKDILRKITSFVDRCDAFGNELLAPSDEDLFNKKYDAATKLTPEFIELMLVVIPFVRLNKKGFTMREVAEACNMDIVKFYDMMTANLYKSPRELAQIVRIEKAAEMLLHTELTVEEISNQCGFYTPNYFMGCFFHKYKLTPKEYRNEMIES